jgi:DNA-binding MarR family transcriptional regulator
LVWFYCNPDSSVYVRQLAGILQVDSTNLSRELARLARRGFLHPYPLRNQLHYKIYRQDEENKVILDTLAKLIAASPDWQRLLPTQSPKTQ